MCPPSAAHVNVGDVAAIGDHVGINSPTVEAVNALAYPRQIHTHSLLSELKTVACRRAKARASV